MIAAPDHATIARSGARVVGRRARRGAGQVENAVAHLELARTPAARAGEELTDRELDVLRQLAGPLSRREIAAALYVSPDTVKTHLRGIYRKLPAASRSEAVERGRELGLL